VLLFATAVFTAIALFGFRAYPTHPEITGADWTGPVGALLARALVHGVGIVAWTVPIECLLLAWPLLYKETSRATVARIAGDFLVGLLVASLIHVAFPTSVAFGAVPLAGTLGELFGELLRSLFSVVGSFLIGLTSIALILIGRSSFSFLTWAERTTRGTELAVGKAATGARAVANAWEKVGHSQREKEEQPLSLQRLRPRDINDQNDILALFNQEQALEEDLTVPPPVLIAPASNFSVRDIKSADAITPRVHASFSSLETPLAPAVFVASTPAASPVIRQPRSDRNRNARFEIIATPPEAPAAVHIALPTSKAVDSSLGPDPCPDIDSNAAVQNITVLSPVPGSVVEAKDKSSELGPKARPTRKKNVALSTSCEVSTIKAEPLTSPHDRYVPAVGDGFRLPSPSLLDRADSPPVFEDRTALVGRAKELEKVLANYGVNGVVADIHTGPTVSTFEIVPAEGTKVSKVSSLVDDLALGLSCTVRIIAPIPGKSRIGFELPNRERVPVNLRELVEDRRFLEIKAPLPVVLGRDIVGAPFYADLAAMPHVIVAGATGAGKSVGLNVMLSSLLTRRTPEELRLLMIDPKVVELAPFDRIPHMLLPVVTDMKQASNALKWAVDEMERRYQLFAQAGTKNIGTYNGWVERVHRGEVRGYQPPKTLTAATSDGSTLEVGSAREAVALPEKLPFIVIVVDEFADLMMQQGKDVETAVARLAQKARAAGMHVVLATQRPSVDVITGMIKANFPTRIAFRVAQRVDSRTILDEQGAEHLLGRGDMLVKLNGTTEVKRVQCPFVSEEEVQRITDFLRLQGEPVYDESILQSRDESDSSSGNDDGELDPKYDDAVRIVAETRRCSTSWLQRKLGLGYNRAAKIVEVMETRGIVGLANGAKDREIFIAPLLQVNLSAAFSAQCPFVLLPILPHGRSLTKRHQLRRRINVLAILHQRPRSCLKAGISWSSKHKKVARNNGGSNLWANSRS